MFFNPFRLEEVARRAAVSGFIETLEARMLLSVAPVTIAPSAIGPSFNGTVHLHYHPAAGVRAHSASAPVTVQLSSLTDGVLDGTISPDSQGEVSFTGPAKHRSFKGVFADGTIRGIVSPRGTVINGSVRETVDGELITGTYRVTDKTVAATSTKRSAAQTTPLNFIAGAGSTVNAISGANGVNAPSGTTAAAAPTEPVSLPALETSFVTADALNSTTTAGGVSNSALNLASVISSTPTVVGSQTATPGATMTINGGTGNSIDTFSSNSGIVSITNSGNSFSSSSGIVSITAPVSFTPSSGIVGVGSFGD